MTGDLTIEGVTRTVELDSTVEGAELDPWGKRAGRHSRPRPDRPQRLRSDLAEDAGVRRLPGRGRSEDHGRRLRREGVLKNAHALRRSATALTAATAAVVLAACAGGQSVSAIPAVKLSKPVADFQEQLVRVVDAVSPAVVQIQTPGGLGSGVVYDGKGDRRQASASPSRATWRSGSPTN
jgi:hypothetical protein